MGEGVSLAVDGVEIQAKPGETIMNAAEAAGIYIPRLCHREDLTPYGGCRVCTVLVNGRPQTACTTPVAPGMIVETDRRDLHELRRQLIEMLFVEGNHFCMFCEKSGNCELQALAYRFGILAPRYPYLGPKREVDASHPDILIDHNRCILCARCIRASRDKDGKNELGFVGRGPDKRLSAGGGGLVRTGIEVEDSAVSACPVGAFLEKRVGYAVPVGKRKYDSSPIGSDIEQEGADGGGRHG
jgi:[NiFe] hydrogenase diaphorase moiety small subunit